MTRRLLLLAATLATFGASSPVLADDARDCSQVEDRGLAIMACGKIIILGKPSKPDLVIALNNRGSAYLVKNSTDLAVADFDEAIRLDPAFANAYYNRAAAYRAKGELDRALADYDKAIQLDPDPDTFINRGSIHLDKGKIDLAMADYDKAIELKPSYALAFNARGFAFKVKGDLDKAIADYDKAIQLDQYFADAFDNRARAYQAKGDNDRAIADYDKDIQLSPNSAAFNNRGVIYSAKGDLDQAMADYSKAIELEPGNAAAFNNRGEAYRVKGDLDSAIVDYDTAILMKSNFADPYSGRGLTYLAKHDIAQALADFEKAIELTDLGEAHFGLAGVLLAKADRSAALAEFKIAAALIPAGDPLKGKVLAGIAKLEKVPVKTASAAAAVPVPVPTAPVDFGRRVALVIGNSAYRSVGLLPNPAKDAELIGAALRQTGVEDVTVAHDLDHTAMVAALKAFTLKADGADWAMVYYAGHGIEVGGINYLIPVDAQLQSDRDVADETVSLERLMSSIEGAHKLRLVVLDACRNNPFSAQMKRTGAARAIGRGLSRIEPTGATLVVYAAKEGTTAADGDNANSPFATAFARRVVEPGVEINKTLRFVRQDVLDATGNGQEPFVYGSLPPTDFFFMPAK